MNRTAGALETFAGRVLRSLFFAVFLAFGLGGLGLIGYSAWQQVEPWLWPEVPATILRLDVEREADGDYVPRVEFRYFADGSSRVGTMLSALKQTHDHRDDALEELSRWRVGAETTCRVDPRNPDRAMLRVGVPWVAAFAVIPLVFAAVGLGGIVMTWKRSGGARVRSRSAEGRASPWAVRAFGGIFVLVGAAVLFGWFVPTAWRAMDSLRWVETPATVISSEVRRHSGDDGPTYSVQVRYRYTFGGAEHEGTRFEAFGGSSSGYEGKAAVVRRYPPGSRIVCYVNPAKPAEAVLRPGPGWGLLFGLIPLGFIAIGLLFAVRGNRANPPAVDRADEAAEALRAPAEPAALVPASSPRKRFFVTLLVAVVWNGVMALFVGQVVEGFRRGDPDWFVTLFLVPFVAAGGLFVVGVVYSALALANPRCRLSVNATTLAPGGALEVNWEFLGSVSRLSHVFILVEGVEEASYRRGTSSVTDRHVFARWPVAEVPGGIDSAQGRAGFLIPDDAPPTFLASNNKLRYRLKVIGKVPRWPDVAEEYDLVIKPEGAR